MLEIEAISYDGKSLTDNISARFDHKGGTLGRSDDNKLVLHDPQKHVSRIHAEVLHTAEGYFLVCRSANRLVVNQVELDQGARRMLHAGDVIQIGSYSLNVRIKEGAESGTCVPVMTTAAPVDTASASDPIGLDDVLGDIGIPFLAKGSDRAHVSVVELMPESQPRLSPSSIDWNAPPEFNKALDQPPILVTPPSPSVSVLPGTSIDDIWGDLSSDAGDIHSLGEDSMDVAGAGLQHTEIPPSSQNTPIESRPPAAAYLLADPLAVFDLPESASTGTVGNSSTPDELFPVRDMRAAETDTPRVEDVPLTFKPFEPLPAMIAQPDSPFAGGLDGDDPLQLGLGPALAPLMEQKVSIPPPPVSPGRSATTPSPEPASQVPARVDSHDVLIASLAQALGLSEHDLPSRMTPEFARLLGLLLHESINGALELVNVRAQARKEIRADLTLISPKRVNNPLKHAPSTEVALKRLLSPTESGYMPGTLALREAFRDIHSHQMGFMAGMQATMASILNRLRPDRVESALGEAKSIDAIVPSTRRARAWLAYQELYQTVANDVTNEFHAQFGKEFLNAYETQIARVRARDATPN